MSDYNQQEKYDVRAIVKRGVYAFDLSNENEFAELLGIDQSTLSGNKNNHSINIKRVLKLCLDKGESFEWLMYGKGGSKLKSNVISAYNYREQVDNILIEELIRRVQKLEEKVDNINNRYNSYHINCPTAMKGAPAAPSKQPGPASRDVKPGR